ncbi:MAG: helix-turn-helix domain-containing protein [Oscillospiraceae bacterium]|nr:helix-turn-helix domain-containing protein [Oscillospiraceae bacterium]
MDIAKFGTHISALRKERDIPQSALADTLGVTRQAVSKWERGEGFPDITILLSIAKLFDVSVDSLMKAGEVSSAGATVLSAVAKGEEGTSGTAEAVDDIVEIAPFMKVSTLSAIAEKLAAHNLDISKVVQLSEFLGDSALAKMLATCDLENLDDELLAKLMPFLSGESMHVIFGRILKGESSQSLLKHMQSFFRDYNMSVLVEAARLQGALDNDGSLVL